MTRELTILIVDDAAINRGILKNIFETEYHVIEAANGQEALDLLQQGDQVDIILLDIIMPVMDGIEFLQIIKDNEQWNQIPVLVNSLANEYENEFTVYELGADDFITKPYNPVIVKRKVDNIVKRYLSIKGEFQKSLDERSSMLEQRMKLKLQDAIQRIREEHPVRETKTLNGVQTSEYDALTGIYNRQTFYQKVKSLLHEESSANSYVICRWNIDNFKVVNELFGSLSGDQVLQKFAGVLLNLFSDGGIVGRLDSDHFISCTTKLDFYQKQEKILSIIAGKTQWNDLNYPVLLHAGVYEVKDVYVPVSSMSDCAELALNSIKDNYLNRIAYYDESLKQTLLDEQQLVNDVEYALEHGQFFIQLQPIIQAATGRIESAEALVRWNHPKRGIIPPSVFIPLFEKNGFVTKIDLFVCREVCRHQKERMLQGKEMLPVSINLSRLNFYNPNICEVIVDILKEYGLDQSYIKIEVTETILRNNQQYLINTVQKFHDYGFLILMDDFGSGYSSLDMLKDIYVDILKIDMKFMADIETSERANNILYSIIQLAKSLKIETLAEGVETQEQYNLLRSMGCNLIQGYYFSKPILVEDFDSLIQKNCIHNRKREFHDKLHTILIVDDEELMRESLSAMLQEQYNIFLAKDGREAMICLKKHFSDIDLVLSDLYMPEHDGFELLMNMNSLDYLKDIPVLMVTAYGESENESKAIGLGALDVVNKPYDPSILKKRIQNLLEHSQAQKTMMEVNALRESMKIKSRVQKIYTNNKAGIACIQFNLEADEQDEVKLLYCNDRMAAMHGIEDYVNRGAAIYSFKDLIVNLNSESAQRFTEKIKERIHQRKNLLQYRYRVNLFGGGSRELIMNAAFSYDNDLVNIDAVVVEELDSQQNLLVKTMSIFSKKLRDNINLHMWQYDMDEDIFIMMSNGMHGFKVGGQITKASEKSLEDPAFQKKDILRLKKMYDQLRDGAQHISEEFLMARKNITEEERQFHWVNISYERIDSDYGNHKIALGIAEDITERIDNEKRKWREKQYLHIMTESVSFFSEVDVNEDRFLDENVKMQLRLFNVHEETNYDRLAEQIVSGIVFPDEASFCTHLLSRDYILTAYEEGRHEISFDFRAELFGNTTYQWYTSSMYLVKNLENGHVYASWQIKNIQREKNQLEEIRNQAERDQMTGLYNRVVFERMVDGAFLDIERNDRLCAFVMIDVDNFKMINDNFGHSFGDTVLKTISKLLSQTFRRFEIIGRLGGDEFAVFIPRAASKERILNKVIDVCHKSYMKFDNKGEQVYVSCSVGVAFGPLDGDDFQKLYNNADQALYQAKKDGKNQYAVYNG